MANLILGVTKMTLDELLIAAKEKAHESAAQWSRSQPPSASLQSTVSSEKIIHKKDGIIQIALVIDADSNLPTGEILAYADRFIVSLLGYTNHNAVLRDTEIVELTVSRRSAERIKPVLFKQYSVEKSMDIRPYAMGKSKSSLPTRKQYYEIRRDGLSFPIIRMYGHPMAYSNTPKTIPNSPLPSRI